MKNTHIPAFSRGFALAALLVLLPCCKPSVHVIPFDKVKYDTSSGKGIYTYKSNGKLVSGIINGYKVDLQSNKKYKGLALEVADGLSVNVGYDFYPNGAVKWAYHFDENGMESGTSTYYNDMGGVYATQEVLNGKPNGIMKIFGNYDGVVTEEIVYQNGEKIKDTVLDKSSSQNASEPVASPDPAPTERYVTVVFGDLDSNSVVTTVVYDSEKKKLVKLSQNWDGVTANESQLDSLGYKINEGDFSADTYIYREWDGKKVMYMVNVETGSGTMVTSSGGNTQTFLIKCRLVSKGNTL